MATTWVTRMWTVFVFAFLKFLSALGLKSSTAAPQRLTTQRLTSHQLMTTQRPTTQPVMRSPAPFIPAASEPCPCELPYGLPYEGFLPPTIKQRIRAEAHGATPTSRRMSGGSAELSHDDPIDTPATATIPDARQGTCSLGPSAPSNQARAAQPAQPAQPAQAGRC